MFVVTMYFILCMYIIFVTIQFCERFCKVVTLNKKKSYGLMYLRKFNFEFWSSVVKHFVSIFIHTIELK